MLNKSRLRKCTIVGDKQLQKRNVATLNSAYQAKKQCNFDSGWLEQQQGGLLNLVKLRGLLGVERKYVQEQPNQFCCYNQNMSFVSRRDQNVARYRSGIRMKNGDRPCLFE